MLIDKDKVEARFVVGLPAKGRHIDGEQAAIMLCEQVPKIVTESLQYAQLDGAALLQHVEIVEDADWLRTQLVEKGLVAFVSNGAILPRRSGIGRSPLIRSSCGLPIP